MKLTIQDIIRATGGRCLNTEKIGDKFITSIITDTRLIAENSLFVPLKGERFDGHHFIEEALKKGAIATLTERQDIKDEDGAIIWVADTQKALLDLAAYYRSQHPIPVVAVTGSVGKTTTKDLIAAVLNAKFNTLKTEGNFNNEIGLPLTLFRLTKEHEMAVVEMGMNHFNEIQRLSVTAKPDIAIITNIGVSHIENLGSREGILKAKLEIREGLKEGCPLVINGDDDMLCTVVEKAHPIITCGKDASCHYKVISIEQGEALTYASIVTPRETYEVTIPALGEHMVYNSLVAIAVAEHFNLSKDEILRGLMAYIPSKMRMNIKTYPNGTTVIDDAYNASPDSMLAALKVLSNYKTSGKRIAILGDMFEMGEFAPTLHEQVGAYVTSLQIDVLCAVGDLAEYMIAGAQKNLKKKLECRYFKTKEACINELEKIVEPKDVVLLKASRGMQFEEIVKAIGKVNDNE